MRSKDDFYRHHLFFTATEGITDPPERVTWRHIAKEFYHEPLATLAYFFGWPATIALIGLLCVAGVKLAFILEPDFLQHLGRDADTLGAEGRWVALLADYALWYWTPVAALIAGWACFVTLTGLPIMCVWNIIRITRRQQRFPVETFTLR